MQDSKQLFIQLCLNNNVLKFGEFTLKSGRKSSYFFNLGLFYNNTALIDIGKLYSDLIHSLITNNNLKFDCLFGPAYKGIPIVTTTAVALESYHKYQTNIAFNRKEAKNHGEGGNIIGCDLTNKNIVLVDDVISAGTATRESINLLQNYNAKIAAVVVALDRQEHAQNNKYKTAADELHAEYNIPIYSIVNLQDIIKYTQENPEFNHYTQRLL